MFARAIVVILLVVGTSFAQTKPDAQAATSSAAQQATATTSTAATEPAPKIDPVKEADIRRLLKLVQIDKLVTQMMDNMFGSLKPLMTSSLPPGEYRAKLVDLFFEKFRSKANPEQIVNLAVPLYDKHFSDDEIRGLISFYETPLGQKAIATLPVLSQELQQEGQKWGGVLGRESMQEVLAEHPDLAEAIKSAAMNNGKQ